MTLFFGLLFWASFIWLVVVAVQHAELLPAIVGVVSVVASIAGQIATSNLEKGERDGRQG